MKRVSYTPATSFLHLLHPLTKFVLLLAVSVAAFAVSSPILMVVMVCAITFLFLCIHQNPFHLHGLRATLITSISIGLIQVIFQRQGHEVMNLVGLSITNYGLQRAVVIAARFLVIVCSSYLFILTTSPSDLSYSMMQLKLPYRYAFMIITSMRLVPILANEGEQIIQAQRQRGAVYTLRKPARSMLHSTTFISAVLYKLVDRVNKLAISMESRSFGCYPTRTFQNAIAFGYRDIIAVGITAMVFILFHSITLRGIL